MRQFIIFSFIGIINTIVDLLLLNILLLIFNNSTLWQFSIFKCISFIIACSLSYFLNSKFTFKDSYLNLLKYFKFITASLSGVFINILFSTIFFLYFQNIDYNTFIKSTFSAVLGSIFSFIWNYFIYKNFIFNKQNN